ncbi:glycosyltransferase family 39 protein [Pontibacter sp. E15-1]|uniref:ArnT family glycosyltransferase n=1 Tax=Pontibacter sp. E15-1 TaxID=2919918 RepID=UPI001F503244|nr:glycosyltransferase family 39 protein [Pontibacter sp. E15-1]MCJ8165883.1 glycosyltransferase family 39 protein [Pontibacter sp. E15-1]
MKDKYLANTYVQLAVLLLLTGLTFFTHLGALEPTLMEARNFITAREMTEHHNWLIPTMNGELRLAKPPLPTWATALAGVRAGDMYNLAALRFPASVMAGLTVLFLFLLARQLTRDRLVPFLAGLVLLSSYLFVHLGRQATWDIYCHSFMLGAIWLFVVAYRRQGQQYGVFALSGLFLGLSFMSKGPVSFYALLLPFLLSYAYGYGLREVKEKRNGMLLALGICAVVAMLWPLYVHVAEPESLSRNMSAESTAWISRHVKAVWYYWTFPGEMGLWTLLTFVALLAPYARPRIGRYGNYRFLAAWVLVSVVLLSLVPEKKERYLLPMLLPMALLTAHYLKYLIDAFAAGRGSAWDRRILQAFGGITALAVGAVPVFLYFFAYRVQAISVGALAAFSVFFLAAAAGVLWLVRKKAAANLFISGVGLHVVLLMVAIPIYERITAPAHDYAGLEEVRELNELRLLPFYSVNGMRPESVWEVGKEVDTIRIVNRRLQIPGKLPAIVFSVKPIPIGAAPAAGEVWLRKLNVYNYSTEAPEKKYHMYLLTERTPQEGS